MKAIVNCACGKFAKWQNKAMAPLLILLIIIPAMPLPVQAHGSIQKISADSGINRGGFDGYETGKNNGTLQGNVELPAQASAGWWATVQEDIKQSEYHITWQKISNLPDSEAAYSAPNRAHNLRTSFTTQGIQVAPRNAETPGWVWGLSLLGYGYAGDVRPVQPANLTTSANRIEYFRGAITEWYVNDQRGLEQGFSLYSPPTGGEAASQVVLSMKVSGDLSASGDVSGGNIDFTTSSGVCVLRYGKLSASDASGRELPASLALARDQIDIYIDTQDAAYPITVDPLATSPVWMAESNQMVAYFGNAVASAGDVNGDGYSDVIVGAYQFDAGQADEGRVFVYHGSASGLSTTANWTAEGDQAGADFGCRMGLAGDVNGDGYSDIIVGARRYDNGLTDDDGSAFVYYGSASGLSTTADWTKGGNQPDAQFGYSVAGAGDVNGDGYSDIIVGAPYYDNSQTNEGRAFVYHGSASGLSATTNWAVAGDQSGAAFGISVAGAGDVNGDGYSDVIVGAYLYDHSETDEGRALVYHGSASGLNSTADWTVESNQANATFGSSVEGAGDVNGDGYSDIIVGAPFFDSGQSDEGRAFVYHGSASGLSTTANWMASGDQAESKFGTSVASAGDVNGDGYADVIIGAYDLNRAYVYYGSSSGPSPIPDWTEEGDQTGAGFGVSVAGAGDVNGDGYSDVIVGAPYYDNGQSDEGRAYVYYGSSSGPSPIPNWTAEGDQTGASFGNSVASAGDVNGDGYSDAIIGAPVGMAFVHYGSASGLSTSPSWTAQNNQLYARYGWSVAGAGDVNGDGYSDVIVGAEWYDGGDENEGKAFIYHGSASGLSPTANWTAEGEQADAEFACSVAGAGDVNGDGYSDVTIGASYYDNGQTNEGMAFVYLGSASGLNTSPNWTAESNQANARFGISVDDAGDVNGDGYSDVIVGAYRYGDGRTFVYHGSASGLSPTANWTVEGEAQVFTYFGLAVAGGGDVNGDGYSDVIVGAPGYSKGFLTGAGKSYVYHGSAAGLSASANWTAEGDQANANFGRSVAGAGDVDGKGYSDVIVGANWYGEHNEGKAFLYHGSAAGLSASAGWTAESDTSGEFGYSVAGAGDVNGDGYADIIVGAPFYQSAPFNQGGAFVYYGNNGGVSLNPRQRRADDSAPIAYLGKSEVGSFRLALLGRTPYGREKVKLEWEVKPLGTSFDGLGTVQSAAWTDTGTAGAAISEMASSLISNTCYHWRLRLLYHPTTIPFQPHSRWMTIPINGWQETDLRLLNSPITLTAVPGSITADGISTSTLTASVKDPYGDPVADNTDVVFTTSRGAVGSTTVTKHTSGGIATATLTSELSTQIVVADVSAAANSFSKTIAVFFTPLSAPPITDNKTETVTDNGTITGTSTGGSITVAGTGPHTVTTAKYDGNPGDDASIFQADSNYYDVHVDNTLNLNSMTIQFSPATESTIIYYWNGSDWLPASNQTYAGGIVTVTVSPDTTPCLSDLSGLFFGSGTPSAPTVINYPATSIMATTAILNGNLTSDGGTATTVIIYGGTIDGETPPTRPGNWAQTNNIGVRPEGAFSLGITGLSPNTKYYYRCYATSTGGSSWATSSASFTTQANLGLWKNYWAGPGKDWFWFSSGGP